VKRVLGGAPALLRRLQARVNFCYCFTAGELAGAALDALPLAGELLPELIRRLASRAVVGARARACVRARRA
jgi:hypothetical protein